MHIISIIDIVNDIYIGDVECYTILTRFANQTANKIVKLIRRGCRVCKIKNNPCRLTVLIIDRSEDGISIPGRRREDIICFSINQQIRCSSLWRSLSLCWSEYNIIVGVTKNVIGDVVCRSYLLRRVWTVSRVLNGEIPLSPSSFSIIREQISI